MKETKEEYSDSTENVDVFFMLVLGTWLWEDVLVELPLSKDQH